MLPGWGNVTPFTMLSASQYWPPGPSALSSPEYARLQRGENPSEAVSTVRTPEQTEVARFQFEGPLAWYRIARAASEAKGLDLGDSARALAALSLAMADSYIAGFKIRYVYDFWRPVTAIRWTADDGNEATGADPTWKSHQNTPSVSDYASTRKPVQWRGGDRTSWGFRYRPGRIHHHERSAILKHPAVLLQLLGGRQGERKLSDLRRYPLLLSL